MSNYPFAIPQGTPEARAQIEALLQLYASPNIGQIWSQVNPQVPGPQPMTGPQVDLLWNQVNPNTAEAGIPRAVRGNPNAPAARPGVQSPMEQLLGNFRPEFATTPDGRVVPVGTQVPGMPVPPVPPGPADQPVGSRLGLAPGAGISNQPVGQRLVAPPMNPLTIFPGLQGLVGAMGGGEQPTSEPRQGPPMPFDTAPANPAQLWGPMERRMADAQAEARVGQIAGGQAAESARIPMIQRAIEDVRFGISSGLAPADAIRQTLESTAYRGQVSEGELRQVFGGGGAPAPAEVQDYPRLPPGGMPGPVSPEGLEAATAPQTEPTTPTPARVPTSGGPGGARGAGGGTGGTGGGAPSIRGIQQPDYAGVRALYEQSRPADFQADSQRMALMGLLGGLANIRFTPGERLGYGLGGALGGVAQGFAGENVRQEGQREARGREQRDFTRGLAGLVGGQEDSRYRNQIGVETFERDSRNQEREFGLRGAALGLQREDLALRREQLARAGENDRVNRQIQLLRLGNLLRESRVDTNSGAVIMGSLERILDGNVNIPGLTIPMPGPGGQTRNVTLAEAQRLIGNQMLGPQAMRDNPSLMSPVGSQVMREQIRMQLGELVTRRLMELQTTSPDEFRAVIETLALAQRSRPSARVTPNVGDLP